MYTVQRVTINRIGRLCQVERILYRCGKDMAERCGLHHWDNTHLKNAVIVAMCAMKNRVYLVFDEKGRAVGTFQLRKSADAMHLQKLAADPAFHGRGVGSCCLKHAEQLAGDERCDKVCLEVYDRSSHAIDFYLRKGYRICGTTGTLKYSEVRMEKRIGASI